jgi:pimeloyl-ACP methyl ester carboxylesterase
LDTGGQRVSARDRLYLASELPTLIVWGAGDRIIPASHGREAHAEMPDSRLEILEGAGHFPHLGEPDRFADLLADFISTTQPPKPDPDRLRRLLRHGAA